MDYRPFKIWINSSTFALPSMLSENHLEFSERLNYCNLCKKSGYESIYWKTWLPCSILSLSLDKDSFCNFLLIWRIYLTKFVICILAYSLELCVPVIYNSCKFSHFKAKCWMDSGRTLVSELTPNRLNVNISSEFAEITSIRSENTASFEHFKSYKSTRFIFFWPSFGAIFNFINVSGEKSNALSLPWTMI